MCDLSKFHKRLPYLLAKFKKSFANLPHLLQNCKTCWKTGQPVGKLEDLLENCTTQSYEKLKSRTGNAAGWKGETVGPHAVPQPLGQTSVQVGQVGARGAQGSTQQSHPLQLAAGPTVHNHLAHRDRVGPSETVTVTVTVTVTPTCIYR